MLTRGSCVAASSAYDKMVRSDGRFFDRRPHRRYRIRRAHAAETIECESKAPELRFYAVIRNLRDGMRVRMFVVGPPSLDTDLNDSQIEFLLANMKPLAALA
jgi:hypothetical protein